MADKIDTPARLHEAVKWYWKTRNIQGENGEKDSGQRSSVTGGKQLNGFGDLLTDLLVEAGISRDIIFLNRACAIPGFFRPTKDWDFLVVEDKELWIAIELKSHAGPSFGNNYNNRIEEGLGSASDIKMAFREGSFGSVKPFIAYLFLLEDCPKSMGPVRVDEPHFPIREEFRDENYLNNGRQHLSLSYAGRDELYCRKMYQEGIYDATAFMLTNRNGLETGEYSEPADDLTFMKLAAVMMGKANEYLTRKKFKV